MATSNALSDFELVDLLKRDDYAAFTEIYNRYWEKLVTAAGKRLPDLETAEELVQDIFLSFFIRRHEIQLSQTVEGYLMSALKHQVFKAYRSLKIREKYVDSQQFIEPLQPHLPDALIEAKELREQIYNVAQKMPEKCREVFMLSRFEQLSQKDIADKLGISINTVKRHINKATSILHSELREHKLELIVVGIFLLFGK
ncbi:RNA polymerase sigma-70 factor [Pedobacter aquatilis]|uniref:RNA polymerase sigma-70 factor n=1 Tax=Pedobacter aquatilis TaxID=351343 RepID=UPI00292EAE97|nr:RNA polymerase sigma-70 factor [Pedobacter aquatilis]